MRYQRHKLRNPGQFVHTSPIQLTVIDDRVVVAPISKRWYRCLLCKQMKPGDEFRQWKEPEHLHTCCKSCRLTKPMPVTNNYIKGLLRQRTTIPPHAQWPESIIQLVRLKTQLRWLRKNHEDNERYSGTIQR